MDLEISSAEVTDSVLLYCALQPTVTGNTSSYKKLTLVYLVCVRMSFTLLLLLSVFVADSTEQETITPVKPEVNVLQGTDITLSCNYNGNVNNLQWYRQYPGSRPECLLLILQSSIYVQNTSITTPRHTGRLNEEKTRVHFMISSVELEDSALYYCALQPTVTGKPDTLYTNLSRALWINSVLVETFYEEEIISPTTEERIYESDGFTLSCNYTGSYSTDTLLWYQQYPRSKPEFLLLLNEGELKTHNESTHPRLNTVLILAACYFDFKGEESVDQQSGHVTALEGGLVTLSCNYTSSSPSPDLFWYIQLTRDTPQYILRRDRYSEGSNSDEFKKRFDSRLNFTSSSVPLMIQRLQLSDFAVYYCALRSTVTTGWTAPLQKQFDTTHLTVDMEAWLKNILILAAFCCECRGDSVSQPKEDETATEGGQITLTCHYKTDDPSPYLFWYKQRANDYPKYMLMRQKFGTGDNATEFKERFHADLDANSKSVPLTIQRVQPSDSAVYYCALKPTPRVICTEGESVTLSCSYDTSSDNILLYWYQQYPNQAPQFLMVKVPHKVPVSIPLIVDINPQSIASELVIKHLTLADTALYYCAFGNERKVIVDSCGDGIYSNSLEKDVIHGGSVKLSCNYTVSGGGSLLQIHRILDCQLTLTKWAERVDLEISSAKVADSALYYCALRPTVTGKPETLQIPSCTSIEDIVTPDRDVVDVMEGQISGDHITPVRDEVMSTEGKPVTLSCSYDITSNYLLLYWYRQYPNQAPQFLLNKGARSITWEHIPDKRHTSKTSQSSTELVITSLTLADTALYYNALRDCYDQYCYTQ
ncbi:unnamed protein product [Coregonus sp. 'balchen']|nr:unnamed protein product [Coregonus sp. 'balchen']